MTARIVHQRFGPDVEWNLNQAPRKAFRSSTLFNVVDTLDTLQLQGSCRYPRRAEV